MTFEEANEMEPEKLVDVFEIKIVDCACQNCINYYECKAKDQFHKEYPSDTIEICKFFEVC